MNEEELLQSVDAHWRYVRQVIRDNRDRDDWLHMTVGEYLDSIELHYKTAMVHGWKHGKSDVQ